jgi:hypothetical protein
MGHPHSEYQAICATRTFQPGTRVVVFVANESQEKKAQSEGKVQL